MCTLLRKDNPSHILKKKPYQFGGVFLYIWEIIKLKTMKKIVFLITLCSVFHSYGQTIIYNSTSKMDSLDAIYTPLVTDTFPGLNQQAVPEYSKLLKGLGKHLSSNDFYWENDCKIYTKFHSNTNGEIDLFIYRFLGFSLSEEKENEFNRLLKSYFVENKFDVEKSVAVSFSMGGCNSFKATKKETKN